MPRFRFHILRKPADEFESTGGIDPVAFGAELFPDSGAAAKPDEGHTAVSSGTPESSAAAPTPAPAPAAEAAADAAGMTQNEYDAMPKSWRKEMEAHWKGTSPDVRKYVHEREKQVTEGITRYRSGSDNWTKVMSPFQSILAEYPDVNPAEILSTLATNHLAMVRATPAERAQHAIALARGYGVELTAAEARAAADAAGAAAGAAQGNPDGFTPGQLAALQQMLGPVLEPVRKTTEYVNGQLEASATREVDAFFSDPKNEFVNEVANDILQLMQRGKAESLPEAYELAIMRNPEVKAKYLAKLSAATAPAPSTASNLPNVKSSAAVVNPKKTPKTMDDTMAEVIAKHY
jgi:hypothetical protein